MTDIDPELRAAIIAYIRSWGVAETMAQQAPQGIDENEVENGFLQFADGIIGEQAARTDSQSLVETRKSHGPRVPDRTMVAI